MANVADTGGGGGVSTWGIPFSSPAMRATMIRPDMAIPLLQAAIRLLTGKSSAPSATPVPRVPTPGIRRYTPSPPPRPTYTPTPTPPMTAPAPQIVAPPTPMTTPSYVPEPVRAAMDVMQPTLRLKRPAMTVSAETPTLSRPTVANVQLPTASYIPEPVRSAMGVAAARGAKPGEPLFVGPVMPGQGGASPVPQPGQRPGQQFVPQPVSQPGQQPGQGNTPGEVKAVMPPETPTKSAGGTRRTYYRSSGGGRTYYRSYGGYSGTGGSTSAAGDFSILPPAYIAAFSTAFNIPITEYYTAERGGAAQAVRDYQNVMNLWQSRTGRPITPDELVRLLTGFDAYSMSMERNPSWDDFINYVMMMSEREYTPAPTPVSYLNLGAI